MLLSPIVNILLLATVTSASPLHSSSASPLPVVIWHGLGDRSDADGLASISDLLQTVHPGVQTHIISLGEDGAADQRASFFGNVTAQSDQVCAQLSSDPLFSAHNTRIDALGFSQGGLFLRGLVQRCPGIRVRSLLTFGSPHNGVAELPACRSWDLVCRGAEATFESNKWSDWVQGNLVPAQYFRERNETTGLGGEAYLNRSNWLADVNNEREVKKGEYKARLGALEKLVMYLFSEDVTVVPKETSWFADVNATSGEVTDLKQRLLYKEDWIGLKAIDEKGGLLFRTVKGGHMRLTDKLLQKAFKEFFGPETKRTTAPVWSAMMIRIWQDVSLVGGDW